MDSVEEIVLQFARFFTFRNVGSIEREFKRFRGVFRLPHLPRNLHCISVLLFVQKAMRRNTGGAVGLKVFFVFGRTLWKRMNRFF